MLYYLFRFLEQWGITGSHMWGYISFRALLALILSLVISAWFGEKFIKYLKSKQITETQRDASCAQCQRILDKLLALNHAHLTHLLTMKPQASSSSSCSSVRSSV